MAPNALATLGLGRRLEATDRGTARGVKVTYRTDDWVAGVTTTVNELAAVPQGEVCW